MRRSPRLPAALAAVLPSRTGVQPRAARGCFALCNRPVMKRAKVTPFARELATAGRLAAETAVAGTGMLSRAKVTPFAREPETARGLAAETAAGRFSQ